MTTWKHCKLGIYTTPEPWALSNTSQPIVNGQEFTPCHQFGSIVFQHKHGIDYTFGEGCSQNGTSVECLNFVSFVFLLLYSHQILQQLLNFALIFSTEELPTNLVSRWDVYIIRTRYLSLDWYQILALHSQNNILYYDFHNFRWRWDKNT